MAFFEKRTRPLTSGEQLDRSTLTARVFSPLDRADSHVFTPTVELSERELTRVAGAAWRVLRRLGVAEHSVPDAVQDALLVVHRRLPEFRGDCKFDTWVYGILLRVASDYRRRVRRAARIFSSANGHAEQDAKAEAPSPHEQLEQREAGKLLRTMLDLLPETAREVFVLVELEELPLHVAALALNISASTAKSRLKTARRGFDLALKREQARRGAEGDTP